MNALDLVVLALILAAGFGGWRLGLIARIFAWGGVALGLVVGARFVPRVVTAFGGTSPASRALVAVIFLALAASLGQSVGLALGHLTRRIVPLPNPLPRWDRGGRHVGRRVRRPRVAVDGDSVVRVSQGLAGAVVARLDRRRRDRAVGPATAGAFRRVGAAISDAPFPSALGTLQSPPNPGPPPGTSITSAVDASVRGSIVKVTGRACDEIQEGSGWVATPGRVVTNAHVVAGETSTFVQDADGRTLRAAVISFDPIRDVAVLAVPTLTAPPLVLATGKVGNVGAVYGHPGGGLLDASPARVGDEILAAGTDIYRTGTSRRHVYVLAADLAPGDSGGALVNDQGDVIGMAFAIDPGRGATAYALTDAEIRPVLRRLFGRHPGKVRTGRCLVG